MIGILHDEAAAGREAHVELPPMWPTERQGHFNSRLRANYFGLTALAWILHPLALVLASRLVLREFHRCKFRPVMHRRAEELSRCNRFLALSLTRKRDLFD